METGGEIKVEERDEMSLPVLTESRGGPGPKRQQQQQQQPQQPPPQPRTVWDAFVASTVLFLYLLTPTVVRIGFKALECKEICDGSYLFLDQNERCWEGAHAVYVTLVAVPAVILYGVLLPALALSLLVRSRSLLFVDEGFMFRWGLIYSGYGEEKFWWEIMVTMRKTLTIVIVTFLRNLDRMQVKLILNDCFVSSRPSKYF